MNCKEPLRRSVVVSGQIFPLVLALMALLPHLAQALTADQVYERVKDSVVVVKAYDRAGKAIGLGSGVVLPSRDIVTNYHVVKAGVKYTVGQKGKTAPAFLQGSDSDKDLALLLAPGLAATPARLGQASQLKVGEKVFAVGAPQGLELSLSEGIVSQLRGGPPPIIQNTVAISPGSSGGGLFNAQGELVGIVTFYLKEGQSLNFALPVEWVREVATSPTPKRGKMVEEKGPVIPAPGKRTEEGWDDKANDLSNRRDWQGLLAHSEQWTRAEPSNSSAWAWLGVAYSLMGRFREAEDALQVSLRLRPDYAEAWAFLALTYAWSGKRDAAFVAVNELRRYNPKLADQTLNYIIKR